MAKVSKTFKYDLVKMIEAIRERSCLWDKNSESYKDRIERKNAWEEIFSLLDESYNDMGWQEKRTTGEYILHKWTNVRDTFVRTLKHRVGKPKKRYLYHDQMKFLIPEDERANYEVFTNDTLVTDDADDVSNEETSLIKEENNEERSYKRKRKKIDYNEDAPRKSKNKEKKRPKPENEESCEENGEIDFVEVNDSEPRLMNEDEAFFASLLPTVVKYDEDERLEFRIEVLALMKKIKDKKKGSGW